MLVGAGGNIAVQIGDDGVLLVDTGTRERGQGARGDPDADRQADPLHHQHAAPIPITSAATKRIGRLGSTIAGGNVGAGAGVGAGIIAHENVLNRMSAPTGKRRRIRRRRGRPTRTSRQAEGALLQRRGDRDHLHSRRRTPTATASSSSASPTSSAPATCSSRRRYPFIDLARGGSIKGDPRRR